MNAGTFAHALLDPEQPCPPGLRAWNGSDPTQRFAIYRNNVLASLINALADTFPVVRQLVGDEFFTGMARLHVQATPPRSPLLAFYGEDFPAFIGAFPPAAGLPYLADVARLELAQVRAYHAADLPAVDTARLAAVLSDPECLPGMQLCLHPSVEVVSSDYAIASLWAAHQGLLDLAEVNPGQAECALVLRHGLEVEVSRIGTGTAAFIQALTAGIPLGAAVGAALAIDDGFDPGSTLARLLAGGAITRFTLHSGSQMP
ncbi:putative DNA-binding domain-containing protein [Pseudomonas sp. JM0905a]|uniref:HvfC/BufC N-terminal domain-containing protein n=1 Tax=Pseudomonas sp. JM0905a TaxID=2772484 RepID=UPI00168974CA|nr:DNA-binding domain-containing protein [Pseudomonas sp. JM0905a]MBD2840455.1 putative DNA-binding domain-containing protein [Pseudomonas sp. JM0905a]